MSRSVHLPHIQGLRGICILLILLFHLRPDICPNGFFGVDVFFVISGYFLFRKPLTETETFSLPIFLKSRATRILPPYLALILLVSILGIFIFPADDMMETELLSRMALFGMANNHLEAQTANYFSANVRALPLMHLWYMGVLLQAYCLFALLFWCWRVLKMSRPLRLGTLSVISLFSLGVALQFLFAEYGAYSGSTYYWTIARLWEFSLGGLLNCLPLLICNTISRRIGACCLLLTLPVISFLPIPDSYRYVGLAALLGALLILATHSNLPGKLLSWRPLQWVGDISFSLYLIHWPWICYAEYYTGESVSYAWILPLCLCIFLSSAAFCYFIEKRRCSLLLVIILFCSAAITHKIITVTNEFRTLIHTEANQFSAPYGLTDTKQTGELHAADAPEELFSNENMKTLSVASRCFELGDGSKTPTYVLMGDSHAGDAAMGLHLLSKKHDWHGIYLNSYIVPYWGANFPERGENDVTPFNFFNEAKAYALLRWLEKRPDLSVVIITQYWYRRYAPHCTWEGTTISDEQEIKEARNRQLREFCSKLREIGKTVVLLTDTPEIGSTTPCRDIRCLINLGKSVASRKNLFSYRAEYEEKNAEVLRTMREMEAECLCRVIHRERNFFPPDATCAYYRNTSLFRDKHHLTREGSLFSMRGNIAELNAMLSNGRKRR